MLSITRVIAEKKTSWPRLVSKKVFRLVQRISRINRKTCSETHSLVQNFFFQTLVKDLFFLLADIRNNCQHRKGATIDSFSIKNNGFRNQAISFEMASLILWLITSSPRYLRRTGCPSWEASLFWVYFLPRYVRTVIVLSPVMLKSPFHGLSLTAASN